MEKINYIASAGTGKTYTLVSKAVDYYILEKKININNIFITTFTDKAASEVKNRIYERLKEKIRKSKDNPDLTEHLLDNYRSVQHSYIGTIHSLLLRILKGNPVESKITDEINVIDEIQFEALFFEVFERFVEENEEDVKTLTKYFSNKRQIYNIFKNMYNNRWKLNTAEIKNKDVYEIEIERISVNTKILLNKFISEYYSSFIDQTELLKTDLKEIREKINRGEFLSIKVDKNKNFPKLLKSTKVKKLPEFEKIKNNDVIELEESQLIENLEKLIDNVLFLNYSLILKIFEKFKKLLEEKKEEEGLITYDDIIFKSVDLLKSHPEILREYQERFKVFLIDEFQDTDPLQMEVIKLLSEKSDLIVFGDPKQCIYEWRNANLYDYLNFIEDFESVPLDVCYRSIPEYIGFLNEFFVKEDFLNKKFEKKEETIKHIDKKFIPYLKYDDSKDFNGRSSVIEVVKTEKGDEHKAVLDIIRKLLNNGYKPDDIIVLFRSATGTERFVNILKNANIPYVSFLSSIYFNSLEVVTVLNILKLIQFPEDKVSLVAVLKSPLFNYSDLDLYKLKDNLNIEEIDELKEIRELINIKDGMNISEILENLYKKLPIKEVFSVYPDGKQKVANLEKLHLIAGKLESENFQLKDLIDYIEESRFRSENDAFIIGDDNLTKLMTIHKSKGLESKIVIIPFINSRKVGNLNGFYTVEDQLMVIIRDDSNRVIAKTPNFDEDKVKNQIYCEEKRLLYVAFTRAKEKLIIIDPDSGGFIKEINTVLDKIDNREITVTSKELKENKFTLKIKKYDYESSDSNENYWLTLIKPPNKNLINNLKKLELEEKKREEEFRRAVEKKIFTTVSSLGLENKEKEVLEERELKEDDLRYERGNIKVEIGILTHKILEHFSFPLDIKKGKEEILNLLKKYSNYTVGVNKEIVVSEVKRKLINFLKTEDYKEIAKSKILFKEMPFTLKENGTYIEGKIDIVYMKNGIITVADYKTGKIEDTTLYNTQMQYYTKVVKKIFPNKEVKFKFIYLT
ncbi:UvrD-helicase domain-containing protein [Persephonella sp.]